MTTSPTADEVIAAVDAVADPVRAESSAGFFKTGPGEYGEGDVFAGVSVPELRRIARGFRGVDVDTTRRLLRSRVHEHRLIGLFLIRAEFERSPDAARREEWVEEYLRGVDGGRVNNWDLVDSSADPILGAWLWERDDPGPLIGLARQTDLWPRRVGVVGTFAFLKNGDPGATLEVVPIVVDDRRDLIQKAAGWMLREMGKRVDRALLTGFLEEWAAEMGRTALGYATEHLTSEERAYFRGLR